MRARLGKKCAFVAWDVGVKCKQAAPLQHKLQNQGFLSFEDKNVVQDAIKYVIMWRNQQPNMKDIKFIFYQHNFDKTWVLA